MWDIVAYIIVLAIIFILIYAFAGATIEWGIAKLRLHRRKHLRLDESDFDKFLDPHPPKLK